MRNMVRKRRERVEVVIAAVWVSWGSFLLKKEE